MVNPKSVSKSPFSSLDRVNKGGKQSSLASFFAASKPSSQSSSSNSSLKRSSSSSSSVFDSLDHKSSHLSLERAVKESVDIENDRQVDVAFQKAKHTTAKLNAVSFADTTDIEIIRESKARNFKHSKPIQKTKSFDASLAVKPLHASTSMKLSSSNSLSRTISSKITKSNKQKSFLQLSKPASKQRQLPWLQPNKSIHKKQKQISNPRLQKSSVSVSSLFLGAEDSQLSVEQKSVVDSVMNRHENVFYTGSAGTGKSFLLKTLIKRLQSRFGKSSVAVTASTGLAATNIEGTTINRFAGFGLGKGDVVSLVRRVKGSRSSVRRWRETKVLIIDEISMIDSDIFEKLNRIAKDIRLSEKPFGGIQLVLTGDFFQLPPVSLNENKGIQFCFKSKSWNACITNTFLLTKVFRQEGDNTLIDMLNALRIGKLSPEMKNHFLKLERPLVYEDGILPTELYPTRYEVERANNERLGNLPTEEITYFAKDGVTLQQEEESLQQISSFDSQKLDSLMCAKVLKLKEGAQVMNIKNDINDEYIVNGTIGKILCFLPHIIWSSFCDHVKPYEVNEYEEFLVHISKFIGFKDIREQESLMNEFISVNLHLTHIALFTQLVGFARNAERKDLFPLVKYTINSPEKYRLKLVEYEAFVHDSNDKLTRTQLPIILSWALSIHKSQGQTLNRVKVDLTKVFEKGQIYVALSRCVSADNLEIVKFDDRKIQVHQEVVKFYESLTRL